MAMKRTYQVEDIEITTGDSRVCLKDEAVGAMLSVTKENLPDLIKALQAVLDDTKEYKE